MRYDKTIRRSKKAKEASAKTTEQLEAVKKENALLRAVMEGVMHEVRRFNAEISTYSEELNQLLNDKADTKVKDLAETIFYTAGLVSSRMTFADFELNPQVFSRQLRIRSGIYKKFDKARHILSKNAKQKSIGIVFSGHSTFEIDAISAFELVPFVLLDNAIKYSPSWQNVNITFDEEQNKQLTVKISSLGPIVPANELPEIMKRCVRGSLAANSNIPGEGLGLYLASTLRKMIGGNIVVFSSQIPKFKLNQTDYSDFEVILTFKRS